MHVQEFNELAASEAVALLVACADIPTWAAAVVARRPYDDPQALTTYAGELAATWSEADVEKALADHPRIGERHQGAGAGAALSQNEQAGVDPHDADVRRRLADGNRRYEETFDRIYLVRAAGRSADEILELLEERLTNDPETELKVTAEQLREIAALRLQALVS